MTAYAAQSAQSRDQLADAYVRSVLARCQVAIPADSPAAKGLRYVARLIRSWAGQYLIDLSLVGSHAKGTAIKGAGDVDVFVSLRHVSGMTLRDVYNHLERFLRDNRLEPDRGRVALKVTCGGIGIDIVPGRKSLDSSDHWIYHTKRDSWLKTNVGRHLRLVANSKRVEEIRAIKRWRTLHGLDFPSLYLELTVINALRQRGVGRVSGNVWAVLGYLATTFPARRVIDPANSNNVVSSDLTTAEKKAIAAAAKHSLAQPTWDQVIW